MTGPGFMHGNLCAPQYGVHCPMPPRTDNPACPDRTRPPTSDERSRLAQLRALCVDSARMRLAAASAGVWKS